MNTVASPSAATRVRAGQIAVPRAPRRVSGPTRPARRPAPARRRGSFADRATGLADARLLDRLIRGRAWIAVIGVMLMGLVFVQVSMLRLNTGIGRDVATAAQLERTNQTLRNSVANLAAGDRIEAGAARLGMVMPAAGEVHYLQAGSAGARRAAAALTAPRPVVQQPAVAAVTTPVTPAATTTAAPVTPGATATPAGATPAVTPAMAQQATPAPVSSAPATATATQAAAPPSTGGAAPTP